LWKHLLVLTAALKWIDVSIRSKWPLVLDLEKARMRVGVEVGVVAESDLLRLLSPVSRFLCQSEKSW
jgi:hypothetical protein